MTNPYAELVRLLSPAPTEKTSCFQGNVLSTDPLTVRGAGLDLDDDDLLLIKGIRGELVAGDKVVLLAVNEMQSFIVLGVTE